MSNFFLQNPLCLPLPSGVAVVHPGKITFKAFWVERVMSIYCEEEGKAKMLQGLCHSIQALALERSLRN